MLKKSELRCTTINTCGECGECKSGETCDPVREELREYSGMRYTSDGFDCALPVAIDSHSVCSYACAYCFADNLIEHRSARQKPIGQTSLGKIERVFAGEGGKEAELYRKALKYDQKKNGYPCPIQLGAICDPADNIERQQGWLLKFLELSHKYKQPIRMSTKGRLLRLKDYMEVIGRHPELLWVAFSIITPDDELLEKIDKRAPNCTERLKTMKALTDIGVKCSLRFRPMLPGLSDRTPKYENAYKVLIERATEAGAVAMSVEVGFTPGRMTKDLKKRWKNMEFITGIPYLSVYNGFGQIQACQRPSFGWTEEIMHRVCEEAKKNNLTVGVSDPLWKQLTESGCCCGILPDDPVFGNWERENATNVLLNAKNTGDLIYLRDVTPPWAYTKGLQGIVALNAGPGSKWDGRYAVWADHLKNKWNNMKADRGVLNYFQGALMPVGREDSGDIIYKYVGHKRTHKIGLYWQFSREDQDAPL